MIKIGNDTPSYGLDQTESALQKSLDRLSSGKRINSAADDAAGLAISDGLDVQAASLAQAQQGTFDASSALAIGDGALGDASNIIGQMRDLAMQAGDGAISSDPTASAALDQQFTELKGSLSQTLGEASFNGTQLLDPTASTFNVQTGSAPTDAIAVQVGGVNVQSLLTGTTTLASANVLGTIDSALDNVSKARASFGAQQNRLDQTSDVLQTTQTNLTAASSRIQDTDVAQETSNLASLQVQAQFAVAVRAQANISSSYALKLLG